MSFVRRHVKAVLGADEGKRSVTFVTRQGNEPGLLDKKAVRLGDSIDTLDFWCPSGTEADSQQCNTHYLREKRDEVA